MSSRSGDPDLIGEFECEGEFVTRGRRRIFLMKMPKVRPPHGGSGKRDAHGKPDWNEVKSITAAMMVQIDAGHYTMDDGGEVDPTNNRKSDEQALTKALHGLKPNQRLLWFVRGEADPSAPAA